MRKVIVPIAVAPAALASFALGRLGAAPAADAMPDRDTVVIQASDWLDVWAGAKLNGPTPAARLMPYVRANYDRYTGLHLDVACNMEDFSRLSVDGASGQRAWMDYVGAYYSTKLRDEAGNWGLTRVWPGFDYKKHVSLTFWEMDQTRDQISLGVYKEGKLTIERVTSEQRRKRAEQDAEALKKKAKDNP